MNNIDIEDQNHRRHHSSTSLLFEPTIDMHVSLRDIVFVLVVGGAWVVNHTEASGKYNVTLAGLFALLIPHSLNTYRNPLVYRYDQLLRICDQ